jgi:hypothetical protein
MENNELQPDIASLENLLKSKIEIFDKALKKNMCLDKVTPSVILIAASI